MALRNVVGTLFIACFILFHVECAPQRWERDDDSGIDNGSGSDGPDVRLDDEYEDVGASDADYSSEENLTPPTLPENPIDDGDNIYIEIDVTTNKPATTSMASVGVDEHDNDEDISSEEDGAYEEYEDDDDVSGNGFVSINNNNVGTSRPEKPTTPKSPKNEDKSIEEVVSSNDKSNERDTFFGKPGPVKPEVAESDTKDVSSGLGEDAGPRDKSTERDMFFGKPGMVKPEVSKTDDNDVSLGSVEDAGPSYKPNERDMFFGKPEPVKPEVADTGVDLVDFGVKRTDVMIVFDGDDKYDDSQMEEDPEIASLERGDYKKDDFFDTIGMKKLADFIPKATETKKAQDFIEGNSVVSNDMNDIFGASNGSKTMKDDFFDSIAVKHIAADKVDSTLHASKVNNQVGALVAKPDTQGPASGMTDEEEQRMKQVILQALKLFTASPCHVEARSLRLAKCAVLQDVLQALTISGLTFGVEKKYQKPKYPAGPSMKQPWNWGVAPHVLMRT